MGSGMNEMARPTPNAGVTVRLCSDHRRGSPKKRVKGRKAQWLRRVSCRGVILRKNIRGIGYDFNTRHPV